MNYKEKVLRLIELYDDWVDMLQEDIILYEALHGDDPGHEKVYEGEFELLEEINRLCNYFEKGA